MTTANTNEDKLILGAMSLLPVLSLVPENSLELVKACIEKAGTQIVTLALRRANEGGLAIFLTMCRRMLRFFRTHQEPEMLRKQYALQGFPASLAAEIL